MVKCQSKLNMVTKVTKRLKRMIPGEKTVENISATACVSWSPAKQSNRCLVIKGHAQPLQILENNTVGYLLMELDTRKVNWLQVGRQHALTIVKKNETEKLS